MSKLFRRLFLCVLISGLIWSGNLISHRQMLRENLIRLHVVAASDDSEDQRIKLLVRDAVTDSLSDAMAQLRDPEEARKYLDDHLDSIESVANRALRNAGCGDQAIVTLGEEIFDTRYYDTFSLPAGVYESLRITIGPGQGKNWWCVVFPTLCIPATAEGFSSVAVGAGFPEELVGTLEGEEGYELRFFLLDALGRLENILWEG